jgi:hypothetical protein
MSCRPCTQRTNIATRLCVEYVKEQHPKLYAEFQKEALKQVPALKGGPRPKARPEPETVVKVPVNYSLRTLRPMKKEKSAAAHA